MNLSSKEVPVSGTFFIIDYRWEMIIMNFNIKILKKNRFEF